MLRVLVNVTDITINEIILFNKYLGKDVYVLPHQANTDNSTNQLIKDGAILVETGQDIIEHMLGSHEKEASLKSHPEPDTKLI
jgi:predicted Rossmann fold nucleotide-binding protein DprA/Smf involved in DNA uptake